MLALWNSDSVGTPLEQTVGHLFFKPPGKRHLIGDNQCTKQFVIHWSFVALVRAKFFQQYVWMESLDWDNPLPPTLFAVRPKWSKVVAMLQNLRIIRLLAAGREGPYQKSDLQVFLDKSESA